VIRERTLEQPRSAGQHPLLLLLHLLEMNELNKSVSKSTK
jgi:hypothetical protein